MIAPKTKGRGFYEIQMPKSRGVGVLPYHEASSCEHSNERPHHPFCGVPLESRTLFAGHNDNRLRPSLTFLTQS